MMLLQKATIRLIRTPPIRVMECRLETRLATVKVHIDTDFMDQSSHARELLVELDRSSSETLSSQLEGQLRSAVRSARLKPGTPLPSTRSLAAQLGVSRGLVVGVYAQLGAEGYLLLRRGASPRVARVAAPAEPAFTAQADQPAHNLRPDLPDFSAFPRDKWLTSYRAALKAAPDLALAYGDVRGALALRSALVSYLGRVRGVSATAEHAFVCAGFAQAIGLLCSTLRHSGRSTIGVEDPGHAVIREIVARTGLRPVPIPVDEEGIDVDALEEAGADAVLITPAHQFPTGVVLSPERRARLLDWAERRDAIVAEDDYDAEFRYDRAPVGALQGLSPDRVAYLGSASKTLAPTLRLGWLIPPPRLVRPLADEVLYTVIAPPRLEQLAFADFLERGELDRHLRRMRLRYRRRRDVLLEALAEKLPQAEVRGIAAGLHVLAVLPPGSSETRILEEARARRISLYTLGEHSVRPRPEAALLLGYGVSPEPAIRVAVAKLAEAVEAASA
jgi:GntR family transcriptional regulator/MocR family aminotransferase